MPFTSLQVTLFHPDYLLLPTEHKEPLAIPYRAYRAIPCYNLPMR